ncbi:hypothetical protein LguiA_016608 [Lonicera macranthoides]
MTNYSSYLLSVTLCLLVLSHSCLANRQSRQQQRRQQQSECRIQNLNPLEPNHRQQHEAGVTEQWDQNNEQLDCAGVTATRHIIEPRGLLLPNFHNAPMLVYVVQGQGVLGAMVPGCPETYQSSQQSQQQQQQQGQRSRDQHQKIHRFRQGDVIALPAGIAHWSYNDGNDQLVLVVVHDTSNYQNQLDQNLRKFFLAGNQQEQQQQRRGSFRGQESSGVNIFQGFDEEVLAESFGVDTQTARKLQGQDDYRGNIVRVQKELQFLRPQRSQEEQEERGEWRRSNGLEETLCTMRLRENIEDPERADMYTAQGGRISTVNSQNLPILRNVQLSAERGVLYRNAMITPHWNINAHSVIYVIRGNGRLQIVGNSNKPAFDGEVREGQLLVVPQNFAVVKQAGNQGFEWVSFKTNDQAMVSPLAGKTSVLRAMPEEVLMNAYRLSRDEARRLKFNRQEVTILSPRSSSSRTAAWSIV